MEGSTKWTPEVVCSFRLSGHQSDNARLSHEGRVFRLRGWPEEEVATRRRRLAKLWMTSAASVLLPKLKAGTFDTCCSVPMSRGRGLRCSPTDVNLTH